MDTDFDFANLSPEDLPSDQIPGDIGEPDRPHPEMTEKPKRSLRAKRYEKQVGTVLGAATRAAAEHPSTIPDAAALLYYGRNVAEKMGDLADADERVRKAIDIFSGGVENPYMAAFSSVAILGLQLIRNHEPKLEPEVRGLRIPFTKRTIKLRFGIKLGRVRALTHDPKELTRAAFTTDVVAFLQKQGVRVAKTD
jgi:hypothetical protein